MMQDTIGLGSYAFFWQHSELVPEPLTLADELRATAELGVRRYQICDDPRLPEADRDLADLRAVANDLGVVLELGTRGTNEAHLSRFLGAAKALGATIVRSMATSGDDRPSMSESERRLRAVAPQFEDAGVDLALETYEQISSSDLVSLIEAVASDRIGICLDPANTVAALEHPRDVIRRCAPYTKNVHLKDFAFSRRDGWVGFELTGCRFGDGLLEIADLEQAVDLTKVSAIVEHWLPWPGEAADAIEKERDWTNATLDHFRKEAS